MDTVISNYNDLTSPDGKISSLYRIGPEELRASVFFDEIPSNFKGFEIDHELVSFNLKSTLAQLGLHSKKQELKLDPIEKKAEMIISIHSLSPIGKEVLKKLQVGCYIGKLFAADDRRRVRNPNYLSRLFGRSDRHGRPLLSLGSMQGGRDLIIEKIDGRTVVYLNLQDGSVSYAPKISSFLDTLTLALQHNYGLRNFIRLYQQWNPRLPSEIKPGEFLLARTTPLHILTMFARVAHSCLPEGYQHTSADILQPDTEKSGDIYELFGESNKILSDIPLEFYTLEPHREHISFAFRDKLHECLEDPENIFKAFQTAPTPLDTHAATFIVKGEQFLSLSEKDWITREPAKRDFPGLRQGSRQAMMVERYIQEQPAYPYFKAIEDEVITSQGVLMTRYFPSPLMKRFLLDAQVLNCVKAMYFQYPSRSNQSFFSQQDRAFLRDLANCGMKIYWADDQSKKVLQFAEKRERDTGMFVPVDKMDEYLSATIFGIYGSNLLEEGNFEKELEIFLSGVLEMREKYQHPLLSPGKPIALVTGGGPGAMEVGNRLAKRLGILSCAHIIDFRPKDGSVVNEQKQNPYVEAKMTYRLDRIIERQAEFHLDFPIFLTGGIGTDFEFALEEVSRKVGVIASNPVFLFGEPSYWKEKITPRYLSNINAGTTKGSEWISNCFYVVKSGSLALKVLEDFIRGELKIGKDHPPAKEGFITYS